MGTVWRKRYFHLALALVVECGVSAEQGLEFILMGVYGRSMQYVKIRRYLVLLAAVLLCCGGPIYGQSASIKFNELPRDVIRKGLNSFAYSNIAREVQLKEMLRQAGCTDAELTEQRVGRGKPPNIICTLPGSSDSTIVIGAHTDHRYQGIGVVDDWSGDALLPALFESLRSVPRRHTIVFIGFTDQQEMMLGSRYYLNHLSHAQVSHIRAMIDLECLGMTPTKVWARQANRRLLASLVIVAKHFNIGLQGVDMSRVAEDDAAVFLLRHVPAITIHSVTQRTWSFLLREQDGPSLINFNDYYNSYRLIAAYLAYLDIALK